MFKTSLYIHDIKEISQEQILGLIQSKSLEKKIEGMKELIMYVSQGKANDHLLHIILKEVLLMENNELKRLLYYFLEIYLPLINDSEILLLNNQIRKDLENPNEFVRGFTLKFVSKLRSVDVLNNCYRSIKDNTTHSVGYVRRSAYYCLATIYKKVGIYEDVPKILKESLYKEMDSCCLIQAFCSLYDIDKEKAMSFAYEVTNSKDKDFSLMLLDKILDKKFINCFIEDKDSEVRLKACLNILELDDEKNLLKFVEIIFNNLKEHEEYFDEVVVQLTKIKDRTDISRYVIDILQFINPYNFDMSKSCLSLAFNVCKSRDVCLVLQFIINKYKEIENMTLKNKALEILLIEYLSIFTKKFAICEKEIDDICIRNLKKDFPGLVFASLELIEILIGLSKDNQLINGLVNSIKSIKYGKIFRKTFEIIVKYAEVSHFNQIINFIEDRLKNNYFFDCLFFQKDNKFLLNFVCISLTEFYFRIPYNEDLKIKLIAMFIGFTKLEGLCDTTSKSTIFLCIRSISANVPYKQVEKKQSTKFKNIDVLTPLDIPMFNVKFTEQAEKLIDFLNCENTSNTLDNIVQLTGLSDPIYVEADVLFTRYEIILNVLLINQTEDYLQNMLFDFATSQNIRSVFLDLPKNMKARSAITKKLIFRVVDGSNGFISGSVTFKYPNENGEYANQHYTLNFSEIKTYVSDFLESKTCEPLEFKSTWKKMTWENVYSMKMLTKLSLKNVFDKFIKLVNGTIIDFKEDADILVANILCTTRQNDDIFFNVCLAKTDNFVNLECRIRSEKEDVVKSMSNVLGRVVKEVRIK
ncbi:coatomer subunit beta [Vairimorpha ceranae]|uniref:Coatomer subunit beta n=1 Tax=Vairimorpha ceranae TaxID=40302 RepID=A0A0F9WUX9_9MICR|nr:coatomer subunit beta [Vairimorpha ceranae]KAF5141306.1 hypothetical protein G9O61_00g006230 [Vairimorpha ceranae]KKO76543.1 coatomer subunit beta [Vairimorpha ceranae]